MRDENNLGSLGDQILDSVQKAVDSMDFGQLNRTISGTVNSALEEARRQMNRGMGYQRNRSGGQKGQERASEGHTSYQDAVYRECSVRTPSGGNGGETGVTVRREQSEKVAGILFTVFGALGLSVAVILLFVVFIISLVLKPVWGALIAVILFLLALTGGFSFMLKKGCMITGQLKRLKIYLEEAGENMYCSVSQMAERIGKSRKFVARDLQRMIARGILPHAHLDRRKEYFMLNDELYRQYQEAEESYQQRKKTKDKPDSPSGGSAARRDPRLEKVAEAGRAYLNALREANREIPGEVISEKLYRLETVIEKIFDSVEKHPDQVDEIDKFMEYYLPTTVKLVNAYRDFDKVHISGENITMAKEEIGKTLDTINQAFERLLDDLYQDAAFDASTDASVLQAMLKKDGWTGSDFDGRS